MKNKENPQQGYCVDKAPNSQSYKTRSEWKLVLRKIHILKLPKKNNNIDYMRDC